MKKSALFILCCIALVACNQTNNKDTETVDSTEIYKQQLADQNQLLESINEIEERLAAVTEAEGHIRQLREAGDDLNTQKNIEDEITFIENTLEENRSRIAELQKQLESSNNASAQLRERVKRLTQEIEKRDKEIAELRSQVEEQNTKINELDESVNQLQNENSRLGEENAQVRAESENNAAIARNQDAQLNTAYYIYGTTSELKKAHVISSGEVLTTSEFNNDDFIKIDIREKTTIPLDSKHVKLLTSHPEGSYTLMKDSQGKYTLRITDTYKFWSVSKYLVIRVK